MEQKKYVYQNIFENMNQMSKKQKTDFTKKT